MFYTVIPSVRLLSMHETTIEGFQRLQIKYFRCYKELLTSIL